jgi:hypothetical protein
MAQEPTETVHTVVITAVKDDAAKIAIVKALANVTKKIQPEQIRAKLDALPWTLTRSAPPKRASRLARLLERLGATMRIIPPLEELPRLGVEETQILPQTELVSETQFMSATQFIDVPNAGPEAPRPAPAAPSPTPVVPSAAPAVPPPASRPAQTAAAPETSPLDHTFTVEGTPIPDIEPLTLGGLLDRTFRICRTHFWKLTAIVTIPWLFAAVVGMGIFALFVVTGITIQDVTNMELWLILLAGITLPAALVAFLSVVFVSQGAIIHAVSCIYLERPVLIGAAYRFVMGRFWKFLLTSLEISLVALVLFVVPIGLMGGLGLLFYYLFEAFAGSGWWSAFTWPLLLMLLVIPFYCITKMLLWDKVLIIEDVAYGDSFRRSWNLMSGRAEGVWPKTHFMRLVVLLHLFIFISIAVAYFFELPPTLIKIFLSGKSVVWEVITQVFHQIGSVLGGLFGSVCMVIFYYDLRSRKEGFDLKMLAETNDAWEATSQRRT